MIKVPPHKIELAIWRAWPVLDHLIDNTCSDIKDSVYDWCNQCDKLKGTVKSAEDKLFSEKDWHCKAESDLAVTKSNKSALKKELKELHKESKAMGKCKAPPEPQQPMGTCTFHKWEIHHGLWHGWE